MTRKETFGKCECIFSHDKAYLIRAIDETIKILNKNPNKVLDSILHISYVKGNYEKIKEKLENTKMCDNLIEEVKLIKNAKF